MENPVVRDPWLVMRWHRLDDTRRLTGEALPARYYCLRGRLQWRPRRVLARLGRVDCMLDDSIIRCPRRLPSWPLYTRPGLGESVLGLHRWFPNPNHVLHAKFRPSISAGDSYVGAECGPSRPIGAPCGPS